MSGLAANEAEAFNKGEYSNINMNNVEALNNFRGINTPSIAKMQIRLQQLVQQGVLSPEMAETFVQEATAFSQMDPMARNEVVQMIQEKGMDPQARAALHELGQVTGEQERGGREAIMQNAAERGISGSGLEMGSQLANQQGSATRMANQGFQAAADANQRQVQAVGQLDQMDARKAAAQDSINQFNTANRQAVENQNTGWRNTAEAQNLSEKQRIADTNVAAKNQAQLYNKGLYQQDFANKMAKAQGFSGAAQGANQSNLGIAQNTSGSINAVTGGMANKWSDENLKTDIKKLDPKEHLDSLKGFSYEYKDGQGMEDGEQNGVMAQDLQKFAPQAVEDTPKGKTIDYSKMGGPMLAALASLNERLNDLEGDDDGH